MRNSNKENQPRGNGEDGIENRSNVRRLYIHFNTPYEITYEFHMIGGGKRTVTIDKDTYYFDGAGNPDKPAIEKYLADTYKIYVTL